MNFRGMIRRRSRSSVALALAAACALPVPAHAQQQTYSFDIPDSSLADALRRFGRITRQQLVYNGSEASTARSTGARGTMTAREALSRILQGSGFAFRVGDAGVMIIERIADQVADGGGRAERSDGLGNPAVIAESEGTGERDIVVTGSRIRGAQPSSSVITLSRQDMQLSGHNNLGEVIRALPQNFGGGQNPTLAIGTSSGRSANQNNTGASAFNLRGLGPDATLTLLNGMRLPYDGFYQATDVSIVPVAAIERVEILLDGASAIYGSDAIAGVANIVLRRDYRGAEFSVRYGGATDGGNRQQQYTALAGTNWGSGGFLIAGDYTQNTSVRADQREYLSYLSFFPDYEIYPRNEQVGTLFSGHQRIGEVVEVNLDAFYMDRSNQSQYAAFSAATASSIRSDTSTWGIFPSLRLSLPSEWSLRLHGAIGQDNSRAVLRGFTISSGAQTSETNTSDFNRSRALGIEGEGPLLTLPSGQVRLALGGGWRRNSLERRSRSVTEADASNQSYYGYAELNVPLVAEDMGIPLVDRLSLNAAIRREDYRNVGQSTTPKISANWTITRGLDVRASWGRSFKAPTLYEQYATQFLYLVSVQTFLGGAEAGASADAQGLLLLGGNRDLRPERAETFTAGLSISPSFLPNFNLEANWFQIDIRDRVVIPVSALAQALTNPAYAEFVTIMPSAAEISAAFALVGLPEGQFTANFASAPYDPSKLFVIVTDTNLNSAAELLRGVDLTARYMTDLFSGRLSLDANGTWLTTARRRLTSASPETPIAGVTYFPARFRGRIGANWSRTRLTLAANLNHISGIRDTNVSPAPRRDSMTTLDTVVTYRLDSSPIGAFSVNLAVTNLFDTPPPFMQPANAFQVNYDSTNYSALGRTISLSLTKRF